MTDQSPYHRYQRQIILPGFGIEGQDKLTQSKVLVIGAGGLGCPALQYLAAAGVGTIGIVDNDVVSVSNLHRQILYTIQDVGLPKATTAQLKLQQLNPQINVIANNGKLTNQNALDLFRVYDIVIDGTDNFSTRYMINDACVLLNKPLIYGAVSQHEGQVAVFNYTADGAVVNYRDVFPKPPKFGEILNCAEAGVLGVLPGIIGTMQATEAIKIITGIGNPLINQLMTYDAFKNSIYTVDLLINPNSKLDMPTDEVAFEAFNYDWFCSVPNQSFEIDRTKFDELRAIVNTMVVDVRELSELPHIKSFKTVRLPMSELENNLGLIDADNVIVICQSGKRSLRVAQLLFDTFGNTKRVYSLAGGTNELKIES